MAREEYDYSKYDNQVILDLGIENEVKTAYIDYAMSVIIGRALPDVRDGLKPVQCLFAQPRHWFREFLPYRSGEA